MVLRFTFITGGRAEGAGVLQELTGTPAAPSPVFLSPPWGGSRSGAWQGHGSCVALVTPLHTAKVPPGGRRRHSLRIIWNRFLPGRGPIMASISVRRASFALNMLTQHQNGCSPPDIFTAEETDIKQCHCPSVLRTGIYEEEFIWMQFWMNGMRY